MVLSLPLVLMNVVFGRALLGLFGPAFALGYTTLILMSLGQLVNVCVGPVGHILLMTGYSRIRLLNSLVLLAIQLGAGLLLIPAWKLEGAGVVAALSVAVISLLGLIEVFALLRIHPYQRGMIKPLLACGLAGGAAALAQAGLAKTLWIQVLLLGGMLVAYACLLVGLGVNPGDRQFFLRAKDVWAAHRPWKRGRTKT
jgi:O-antigen/teichoic acid export membrane protein